MAHDDGSSASRVVDLPGILFAIQVSLRPVLRSLVRPNVKHNLVFRPDFHMIDICFNAHVVCASRCRAVWPRQDEDGDLSCGRLGGLLFETW